MKRHNIFRSFLTVMGMAAACSSWAQVSVTATAGNTGPVTYPTVSAAFVAINAGTHMGAIDIAITANTIEPSAPTTLLASSGSSSYTSVLIRPVGDRLIRSATIMNSNRGIIELNGADHVTIDGDDPATAGNRNLTIENYPNGNTGLSCIRLSSNNSDGATDNTIKNCIIIGPRNDGSSTVVNYGINMSNYSTNSATGGANNCLNTLIDNNEIKRAFDAIYLKGADTNNVNTGTVIKNNIIGSAIEADNIGQRGIYLDFSSTSSAGAALIQNNDIRLGTVTATATGYSASVAGIHLGGGTAETVIEKNNIHDIMQPRSGGDRVVGIYLSNSLAASGIRIENNFIRDIVAANSSASPLNSLGNYGIRIGSFHKGVVINHNTIALLVPNATGSTANAVSSCIFIAQATATIAELQNNILVNNNTSTNATGVYSSGNGNLSGGVVNNNCYYLPNGSVGYYNGTSHTSLAQWQAATSQETNSLSVNPSFVSATDLHIMSAPTPNALESAGALTTITTDIDGDMRPGPAGSANGGGTAPDIGADEFDRKPLSMNDVATDSLIAPTPNAAISVGNSFTPQASFSNIGSVAQTNVPVRYQVIGAANTIIYNDSGMISSLPAYSGTATVSFTSTAITTPGTYTIRAIAELPGDGFTSNDTVTSSITVIAPLCGTYHIGVAQPVPFNTLTSAVNALDSVGVSCPVVFLLDDTVYNEPNLIQFNQVIPGVSATNTVTLSPNTGTNVALNGNSAGPFIKILSSHVTINGSNTVAGTSRNLTISNKVPSASGIFMGSADSAAPLTHVAVKNCIIVDTITHNAIVVGNGNGATAGYFNNVTIENNDIRRANRGIWATAVTAAGNGSGLLIRGNVMITAMPDAIRNIAIRVEGVDGGIIANNEIANMEAATAQHKRGIFVANGTTNILIKGNTVYNLDYTNTGSTGSMQGIGLAPNTGVVNSANITIDSNFVSNITSSSSTTGLQNQTYGISVYGSKGYTITRNRIHNIENNRTTGYAAYGINLQAAGDTSDVTVANNFISDIKSQGSSTLQNNAFGMYIGDGGGYNIYHNSVNLLSGSQSGSEVNAAIGIASGVSTSGPAIDIRNNIFSNSNTSGAPYALHSAVTTANNGSVYLHLDYNDYYSAGANLAYFSGSAQADITALQAAFAGGNVNSISVQPVFVSSSDLHMQLGMNAQIDDKGTPAAIGGITADIDGEARPSGMATDMGADEFFNNPTAIRLTAIAAANAGTRNKVTWRSADETDGDRYVIEKSTDGKHFSYLGVLPVKGQAASYGYWDEQPAKGINYYRLKMYETDGEFTYSKIVQATMTGKDQVTIAAYPNPAADYLVAELSGVVDANGTVSILDISGKELYRSAVTGNKTLIPTNHLAAGSYLLTYADDTHQVTIKISKQ